MAIPLFSVDVENVSNLSDLPNAEDGLTAEQLKAVFDKAAVDIKNYLNSTLVPGVNGTIARAFTVTFPASETVYDYVTTSYGLNADSIVFCKPQDASQSAWNTCGMKCSAVAENKLTFTATTAPSADVSIDVIVLN